MLLVKTEGRWQIVSQAWDTESESKPIPANFLGPACSCFVTNSVFSKLFDSSDHARRAVDFHEFSIRPQSRRVFDARNTGNTILSCDKCAVLERAPDF